MRDTTCSTFKTLQNCRIRIKILKATFFQNCFKEGLKTAVDVILKNGLDLKSKIIINI